MATLEIKAEFAATQIVIAMTSWDSRSAQMAFLSNPSSMDSTTSSEARTVDCSAST